MWCLWVSCQSSREAVSRHDVYNICLKCKLFKWSFRHKLLKPTDAEAVRRNTCDAACHLSCGLMYVYMYVCRYASIHIYIYRYVSIYTLLGIYMTWTGTVVKSHLESTTHWIMPCPAICVTPYNWLSDWQVIQILILLLLIWSTAHCPLAWSGGGRRCECCSAYGGWSWSWATEDRDRDSGDSLYWL